MENQQLVIRELRDLASVPNGFDPKILLMIQENLAVDVMRLYKRQFVELLDRQKDSKLPADQAEKERRKFFSETLQSEYRSRASNGGGFSLPMYLEAAENFYRMEMGRHLQAVKDYVAHGKHVAEMHQAEDVRELRNLDGTMHDLANRVADGMNAMQQALDKLGRIKVDVAKSIAAELRMEMAQALIHVKDDKFAQTLMGEATNLASAKRYLARESEAQAPRATLH